MTERKNKMLTLFLSVGIAILASGCAAIDIVVAVTNAFSIAKLAYTVAENWQGMGAIGMMTASLMAIRELPKKQFQKWLSRAIALSLFTTVIFSIGLFYAQYHEIFEAAAEAAFK